jgi:hypothetical protein
LSCGYVLPARRWKNALAPTAIKISCISGIRPYPYTQSVKTVGKILLMNSKAANVRRECKYCFFAFTTHTRYMAEEWMAQHVRLRHMDGPHGDGKALPKLPDVEKKMHRPSRVAKYTA